MRGVLGRSKRYVEVVLDVDEKGMCTPLAVVWDDDTTYSIDKVLDVRHATSRKVDGEGTRYTVRVGNSETYLFCEGRRWFVEAKDAPLP